MDPYLAVARELARRGLTPNAEALAVRFRGAIPPETVAQPGGAWRLRNYLAGVWLNFGLPEAEFPVPSLLRLSGPEAPLPPDVTITGPAPTPREFAAAMQASPLVSPETLKPSLVAELRAMGAVDTARKLESGEVGMDEARAQAERELIGLRTVIQQLEAAGVAPQIIEDVRARKVDLGTAWQIATGARVAAEQRIQKVKEQTAAARTAEELAAREAAIKEAETAGFGTVAEAPTVEEARKAAISALRAAGFTETGEVVPRPPAEAPKPERPAAQRGIAALAIIAVVLYLALR